MYFIRSTRARLGQFTHAYERCVTQKGTKLNKGFVFYNNDGGLTVRVRANGKEECENSQFAEAVAYDSLAGVSMVCTDAKVRIGWHHQCHASMDSTAASFLLKRRLSFAVYLAHVNCFKISIRRLADSYCHV